jgi:hypothetical protein
VRQQVRDHDAVMLDREAALEPFAELRDLRAHLALGELGELIRIADPGEQRFEHRPRRLRVAGRGDALELDPGVLEHLLQPLDRASSLVALRRAQPRQVTQLRISGGATKLGRTSPCWTSWQIHSESLTSVPTGAMSSSSWSPRSGSAG